jgi:hypothetical protein
MRALGLETGVAPGVVAAPGADPSLEALRRLLGLARVDAPSMVPAGTMAPQSVNPMQNGASQVARGPAQTTGATMMDPDPAQIREIMHKVGLL